MTPLLDVQNLRVWYGPRRRPVRAVDGVSLGVAAGECVGLVGESGCGKSSLARAALRLEPATGGRILFEGQDVDSLRPAALRAFRAGSQMVFQDPFESLNPRLTVGRMLDEVLWVHRKGDRAARQARAAALLDSVGLDSACAGRYPHEFSGGQRQRLGLARALAVEPRLIIADECVSALDVSVQVQILNLLKDLQAALKLAYLFIAHDLAVVKYMCDRVYVMYLGRVVESGPAAALYAAPAHPYTRALLAAVPEVGRDLPPMAVRGGGVEDAPSAVGCPFLPRCPDAGAICRQQAPALRWLDNGHAVACHQAAGDGIK